MWSNWFLNEDKERKRKERLRLLGLTERIWPDRNTNTDAHWSDTIMHTQAHAHRHKPHALTEDHFSNKDVNKKLL